MASSIETRHANEVHTVQDAEGRAVQSTSTWRLGIAEVGMFQKALEAVTGPDREDLAYFAWLLGQEGVEITITHKWEA
jgi:hypothetical protein